MPKKGGKGKKGKKKADAPIGVPIPPPALFEYLQREYESMEKELLNKSVEADEISKRTREDRLAMKEMEKELLEIRGIMSRADEAMLDYPYCFLSDATQHATFAITSDVAREYKGSQEGFIFEINRLETFLTEQKEELDICTHECQEMVRENEDEIAVKDAAIAELRERMDNMANEFADMISETLTTLRRQLDATVAEFNQAKSEDIGESKAQSKHLGKHARDASSWMCEESLQRAGSRSLSLALRSRCDRAIDARPMMKWHCSLQFFTRIKISSSAS
ncbi:hypothetical protein FOZ62_015869 [Perkinsus olseni]|uniref:Dynein regulatory complex protein 12 n=1 Tax=Perkinsus olseni TaxID=32597 RepID=A0A7J6TCF5_PEROL|nr:hypothetical protein FOZ62_015869 [Perkinsus olseni]